MGSRHVFVVLAVVLAVAIAMTAATAADDSAEPAPWGRAEPSDIDYAPQKVVYDVAARDEAAFERVLDRVSFLNVIYEADPFEASIVVVLHGDELDFFAVDRYAQHRELMRRVHSLVLSGPIEFRVCRVAARGRGLEPEDMHGFLRIVPMADAEIVRLQREEGYAYMR